MTQQLGCMMCRRAGEKLFLKGERCFTAKCAITRRNYAPGMHGQKGSRRSEFGTQLNEKQKVKRIYGLRERQFRGYYEEAARREGVTGNLMLEALERRLDNVVYKMQLAGSRREARQLVSHKHFMVNGRPVNIPSMQIRAEDVVAVKPSSLALPSFKERLSKIDENKIVPWLQVDSKKGTAKIAALPTMEDIDHQSQMQLIVEFYSR